jgi:hypothetical protein
MTIWLEACELRLTVANDKLKVAEEKMKMQGKLLDLAQQALSKQELFDSDFFDGGQCCGDDEEPPARS